MGHKSEIRRYRKYLYYNVSTLLLLFLAFFAYEIFTLSKIEKFNIAIDKAGYQRMLTNQTSMYIYQLIGTQKKATKNRLRERIYKNRTLISDNLNLLLGKTPKYPNTITKPMKKYYYKNNSKNYKIIHKYLKYVDKFIGNKKNLSAPSNAVTISSINKINLQATNVFHQAVSELDKSMTKAVNVRIYSEITFVSFVLIMFIASYIFIYIPMEKSLKEREEELLDKLHQSIEEAEYAQDFIGRHKALFEMAPIPIVVLDVKSAKFIDANPSTLKLFKVNKKDFLGHGPLDYSPELQPDGRSSQEAAHTYIGTAIKDRASTFEWTHTDSTGEKISCIVSLALLTSKQTQYLQGTITNISEQKELEKNIIAANIKLEEANAAKMKFMAVMSHELRTPLNSILGYTEMLKDEVIGELNQEQKDYISEIHQSGQGLLNQINDILDFSKLGEHSADLTLDSVNVSDLLKSCISQIKGYPGASDLKFDITYPEGNLSFIMDYERMKQVLLNILSNSIKFTSSEGTITVSAALNENDALILSVKDTGIGMLPKKIETIFDPFIQADSTISRKYGGTGLGLAIVKEIIELHNGTVSVSSAEGVGTEFTIKIPEIKKGD